jgi:hypothetical protein
MAAYDPVRRIDLMVVVGAAITFFFRTSFIVPDAHAAWPRVWARPLARNRTTASTDIHSR